MKKPIVNFFLKQFLIFRNFLKIFEGIERNMNDSRSLGDV